MKDFSKRIHLLYLLALAGHLVCAQQRLPILRTDSPQISIREGTANYKDSWSLSPATRPDVFVTQPFTGTQRIVFYSSIDSIAFNVVPERTYEFIVLLNDRDTAYTEINTSAAGRPSLVPKMKYTHVHGGDPRTDTIPFVLGPDNYIHLKGSINGSDTLNILFDTGAGICVLSSSAVHPQVQVTWDGTQQNAGSDGSSIVPSSSNNRIRIGGLVWEHVPLLSIDYTGYGFDAVLGWPAFEGMIVEVNHTINALIIHRSLPDVKEGYAKVEMRTINGIPFIPIELVAGGKRTIGWFGMDTGSDGTLDMGQQFARENGLLDVLKKTGTASSKGSTGLEYRQTKAIVQEAKLAGFAMESVPVHINDKDPEGVTNNERIGIRLLNRFNMIMDLQHGCVYVKPDQLFHAPM